jgi:6-phosphogluconolactonase
MKRNHIIYYSLVVIFGLISSGCRENPKLFAGGFTEGDEKGMYVFEFNSRDGGLELVSQSDVGPSPSYFCFSDKNSLIYALNEVMEFKGSFGGGLTTLKYDIKNGQFEKLNEMLIPYAGPCFISMSPDSGFIFIANYPNGSVVVVKLDENGIPESIPDTILYVKEEPDRSHAHMILSDPGGKHIYLTDLGLDRILRYNFDRQSGKLYLTVNGITTLPVHSGPRHFVFNTDGSKLYLINELGSTIMVFNVDETQGLKLIQTLPTVREGFEGNNYCADIHIANNGKFLYGSNRGENSIVIFNIAQDGLLNLAGHVTCGGDWPRNFVIDPSGRFLLVGNQKSDQISVFKINKKTGIPEGPVNSAAMKSPACLKFRN